MDYGTRPRDKSTVTGCTLVRRITPVLLTTALCSPDYPRTQGCCVHLCTAINTIPFLVAASARHLTSSERRQRRRLAPPVGPLALSAHEVGGLVGSSMIDVWSCALGARDVDDMGTRRCPCSLVSANLVMILRDFLTMRIPQLSILYVGHYNSIWCHMPPSTEEAANSGSCSLGAGVGPSSAPSFKLLAPFRDMDGIS